MRVAGIMSGTSLDGIDVAIVDIRGRSFDTVAFHTTPYPEAVRAAILAVSNAATHTAAISRLNFELGERYARALMETCRRARLPLRSVELIGCHGQTIYHEGVNTLQIGEAAVIAERTGIPVVSDFRTRDIAAGGKGAPLVPFVDYLLFRHARRGRVALNIGGIANITAIPPGAPPEQVIAFDTGPGNMVVDALVREHTAGRRSFDRNGRIAARADVNSKLLDSLLRDPYYSAPPPKTAGREQYGVEFVLRMCRCRQIAARSHRHRYRADRRHRRARDRALRAPTDACRRTDRLRRRRAQSGDHGASLSPAPEHRVGHFVGLRY